MIDKINYLREELHKLLESKSTSNEDVLNLSRELDLLIIDFYGADNNENRNTIIADNE